MAAPRRRTSAELQVNGGLMPPSAHVIASPRGSGSGGAPCREEHAVTANGGGPALRGAKPRGGGSVCSATKTSGRRRPAGRMPLWRVFIFVSVALNVAALPLLLHQYIVSHPHHPGVISPDQQHHACAPPPGTSGAAARAPSTGKPSVTSDSVINLDHGDPTMFEAFWRETGDAAELVIPGWQTMSYFSDVGNVCWFMEPLFDQQVRRLHRTVGNAAVDGYHVLVGTGSTQLFMAALYALSPADAAEPTSVVSTAPYYSSYPAVTDFLRSGLFRWAGDANSFVGDAYIELVCSPNNPDGAIRDAVLSSGAGKAVHDLAYYWPQYTPITRRADHDIMLFTVSKSTGHAGTRIGWALVKDREVARRMTKFVELNTIGVSKDSQLRAAKVLSAVSDGYVDGDASRHRLFDFGRRKMVERWRMLREAAAASGIFSLPAETSGRCNFANETAANNPAFAWLRCDREDVEDCAGFLRGHKILTRSGNQFGADPRYVRVSMLDRDDAYDIFIRRLASLK
ncbi:tryptophan aminotransferase-related protein 2-like isoform X2 [Triticum urartu]|uniref:Alliinase C-terminal domain-containing protein n=1 Tax=Triticum urartu TaxID=4572 RepID=A0A8R7TRB9_TRIUA|nr:tryptophan aminotransferase-related protein 2-like isoform X2 [Triticum urartu]